MLTAVKKTILVLKLPGMELARTAISKVKWKERILATILPTGLVIGVLMVTDCQQKLNGKKPPGAEPQGIDFRGMMLTGYHMTVQIITHPMYFLMITATEVIIRFLAKELIHIQVRLVISRQMLMGFTIWRGIYGNGVGIGGRKIGIGKLAQGSRILGGPHLAPAACGAAAVGTATPSARVAPIVTTTRHRAATTAT